MLVENHQIVPTPSIWRPVGGDFIGISPKFSASEN